MKLSRLAISSFFLLLQSCGFAVHQVHVSGFEPYSSRDMGIAVSAHSEQHIVLGFSSETKYVDNAVKALLRECPTGDIVGITTEYQTEFGFFAWTDKIYLRGLCVNKAVKSPTKPEAATPPA